MNATHGTFVIRQAGAGGYFENGVTMASFDSREAADAALPAMCEVCNGAKYGELRVEDWTPTASQREAWAAAKE